MDKRSLLPYKHYDEIETIEDIEMQEAWTTKHTGANVYFVGEKGALIFWFQLIPPHGLLDVGFFWDENRKDSTRGVEITQKEFYERLSKAKSSNTLIGTTFYTFPDFK